MKIHDWLRAPAGYFHHFHQFWTVELCKALNDGRLPEEYFALVEQPASGLVPDVLSLREQPEASASSPTRGGGIAIADVPVQTRFVSRSESGLLAAKANRVVVHSAGDRVVAVIEVVSPGNKHSTHAVQAFVRKSVDLLRADVNLLVADLHPPTARDPQGIHPLIWAEFEDEPFELPPDKPLTLAAYVAGPPETAYVEPVAVGDPLPDMPVFLDAGTYVPVPLGPTYEAAWALCPPRFRRAVEPKEAP